MCNRQKRHRQVGDEKTKHAMELNENISNYCISLTGCMQSLKKSYPEEHMTLPGIDLSQPVSCESAPRMGGGGES
jgi:hypothetical protein